MFLETSQIHRKTPVPESLFYKVAGKRDSDTGKFWQISKNTFSTEHLWTTASGPCQTSMIELSGSLLLLEEAPS